MTSTTQTAQTTQVYRVWIRATPQAIWDAITKPEWTDRYGYTGLAEYDLRPGGPFRVVAGEEMEAHGYTGAMVDGEVIEADPPHKLVQTWRLLMDPQLEAEGFTRLTYEIEDTGAGGGWGWILSDLKSLLETGERLRG